MLVLGIKRGDRIHLVTDEDHIIISCAEIWGTTSVGLMIDGETYDLYSQDSWSVNMGHHPVKMSVTKIFEWDSDKGPVPQAELGFRAPRAVGIYRDSVYQSMKRDGLL